MLERELFALLEHTGDAAYCVTPEGEIRSWNAAAEDLFGYRADEAVGRAVDELLDARDALGTEALSGGLEAVTRRWTPGSPGIPCFDLDVRTRDRGRIWVNVSTLVFDNERTGRRMFVRLARDVTRLQRQAAALVRAVALGRELAGLVPERPEHAPVDDLTERERKILVLFAEGRSSAAVARTLRISPQTLRNYLHRINRKLRTHSRLEAVTHARQRGLIP